MKGLLLKDIYNLSGQLKTYACFPFLAAFLAYQSEGQNMVIFACSFLAIFVVIAACAYDEMADFNSYALTLPLTRRDLVISKYILSVMTCLVSAGISILIGALLLKIFPERFISVEWQEYFVEVIVVMLVMNMLICIILPMIFRFGTEKARIMLVVLFLAMGCLSYIVSSFDFSWFDEGWISFLEQYAIYVSVLAAIVIETISIAVSQHILSKKEF